MEYEGDFRYLDVSGSDLSMVEKVLELPETAHAPIEAGTEAGRVHYYLNGMEIGSVPVLFSESVEEARFTDHLRKIFD